MGGETMEEYLYTCNTVGQPTWYKDGQCMTSWEQVCKNAVFCGDGCKPCDKLDKCNKYHQTDCTLKTEYVAATELDEITMNGCTGTCIAQSISNPSTYFTWDKAAEACKCYNGGTRDCVKEVVMAGFSHADVVHVELEDSGLIENYAAADIKCIVQYSIAQYSIVQYSIVQYSIEQYGVVQYIKVQQTLIMCELQLSRLLQFSQQ